MTQQQQADDGAKKQDPDRAFVDQWRKSVLAAGDLTAGQKVVGVAYSFHFHYGKSNARYRMAWVGSETLAPEVGMKPETVEKSLRTLRKKGYLESTGRTAGAWGSTIDRFIIPEKIPSHPHENAGGDSSEPLEGGHVTAGGEQTTRTRMRVHPARECGYTPHENADNSLRDSLSDSLEVPTDGHSQANGPTGINHFIEVEEKQRREEFVNYWSTVAMKYDNPHDYNTVLDIFSNNEDMAEERRTDWGATFMHFMANMAGGTPPGGTETKVENTVTDLESTDEPTTGHEDLMEVWQGRADDEGAFRKAWEQLKAGGHEDIHIIAVGASEHVSNKYPRELGDVLTTLPKSKRARAVGAYRRAVLT